VYDERVGREYGLLLEDDDSAVDEYEYEYCSSARREVGVSLTV
jgi:hypothetical protein